MLSVDIHVTNEEYLDKYISCIKNVLKVKNDNKFQNFIKDKVSNLAIEVTDELLDGGTTNDEYIDLYKTSHVIEDTEEGFVLYNNANIDVENENYPNGFSIALAFEYGVGIVGEGFYTNDYFQPWEYNVNNYNFGWYFSKNGVSQQTAGYKGFEIYRNIAEKSKKLFLDWILEFFEKEV